MIAEKRDCRLSALVRTLTSALERALVSTLDSPLKTGPMSARVSAQALI